MTKLQILLDTIVASLCLLLFILTLSIGEFYKIDYQAADAGTLMNYTMNFYTEQATCARLDTITSAKTDKTDLKYINSGFCKGTAKYHLGFNSTSCKHIAEGMKITMATIKIGIAFSALALVCAIIGFFFERGFHFASYCIFIPCLTTLIGIISFLVLAQQNMKKFAIANGGSGYTDSFGYTFYILIASWLLSLMTFGGFSAIHSERELDSKQDKLKKEKSMATM